MQFATFAYLFLIFQASAVTQASVLGAQISLYLDSMPSQSKELNPGEACHAESAQCREGSVCEAERSFKDDKHAPAVCKLESGANCTDFPEFCEKSAMCENNTCKVYPGYPCEPDGVQCGGGTVCTDNTALYFWEGDPAAKQVFVCVLPLGADCTTYPNICDMELTCDKKKGTCVKAVPPTENPLKREIVDVMVKLGGALGTMIGREDKLEKDMQALGAQLQEVKAKLHKDSLNEN